MTKDDENLPARRPGANLPTAPGAKGKAGGALAAIRAGKAAVAKAPPPRDRGGLLTAALAPAGRPRLVFAMDATASREHAWDAARKVTDGLFAALPGQLDVALAVHGGSRLHTFTDFTGDPGELRRRASDVHCEAGTTRLVDIMDRVREHPDVRVVIYIGDVFEEDAAEAARAADALRLRGCRVIVLHDRAGTPPGEESAAVFEDIARRTMGTVVPFDAAAPDRLRALLEAVGALAAGGIRLLEMRRKSLPGAALLLEHLQGGGKPKP